MPGSLWEAMVFGIFNQHLQVDSPPLPGRPAGSPAHGLLSLTPTGAVLTLTGSMPAPPLPQEPQAWGFETPSGKTRHSAMSPAGEPLTGPKMPDLSGLEGTPGSKKPQPPVLALVPMQPPAHGGLPVPNVSPSVAVPTTSESPTVVPGVPCAPVPTTSKLPTVVPGVPCAPVVPVDAAAVAVSVPAPETTLANAAYIGEVLRQRRDKKNKLQKLRRKGNRAGWVDPDDAALKAKCRELLRRKQLAKAAQGTEGKKTAESTDPLDAASEAMAKDEDDEEPGESRGSPVARQARTRGRPKASKTLAKEAHAKVAAKGRVKAKVKAKAKAKVKAQAKSKAKAKAETVSTSSSSRPDLQVQERVQVNATFAGRYVQDDDRWKAVLAGWGAATEGGLNSDSLQRKYWTFVHKFVKGKSGFYKDLVAQAAKEWAKTPEAMEGKARRANVRTVRKERVAKERAAKKAGKAAEEEEDLAPGLSTSGDLGDDFDDDDERAVPVVPGVPVQSLGDDFSGEENAVPLTQPESESEPEAEAGDALAESDAESTAKSAAKPTAKSKAKAKAKPRAKKCGDAAVSEEANEEVESGGRRRKSAAISEAAGEPEETLALKPSKRCRKTKVAEIPFN